MQRDNRNFVFLNSFLLFSLERIVKLFSKKIIMKYLPYIYEPDRSLAVYKQTEEYFTVNPEIKERIEELGWTYHTIGMIIPQTTENFWSGHYFPYMESWDELQISFNLICFGLYKQAFVSLRSGLELGLLSVYYNINDEGHKVVQEWLKSKDSFDANTPRFGKIWQILLSNDNIKNFNDKNNLRQKFDDLGFLHNYVHSKGGKFSNRMGTMKGNYQTFEKNIITKWINCFETIISLLCTLHLLKYPISVVRFDYSKKFGIDIPSFGGLEESYIDRIAKILPDNFFTDIEEIAEQDPTTQDMVKWLNSLPDITEEQVDEQILNLEKSFIKNGQGFNKWLEDRKELFRSIGQTEFDEKTKKQIELLREWATENGFL